MTTRPMPSTVTSEDIILISSDSDNESTTRDTKPSCLMSKNENPSNINKSDKEDEIENNNDTNGTNFANSKKSANGLSIEEKSMHVSNIDNLFEKFIEICVPLIEATKNATEIVNFVKSRHACTSADFKASKRYRNLLNRCIRKLKSGSKQQFVYINEIATELGQHSERKRKANAVISGVTKAKLVKVDGGSSSDVQVIGSDSNDGSCSESTQNIVEHDKKTKGKIEYYENLLKRFSDEIKRLQAHELTLDEMIEEDSIYIQEGQLKRKAMKIFEKLCTIQNLPLKTGRVVEQKVKLTSSRFPEINRKVESYVNRVRKFPDFYDINYLVKQTNKKHNFLMEKQEIEQTAKSLFQEVGKHMQRIRHYDFIYNFGSYLTDVALEKSVRDPSETNPDLLAKLKENRQKSKSALDDVIKKYSQKQEEGEDSHHQSRDISEKESDQASEPPSEASDSEVSESASDIDTDDIENFGEGCSYKAT